MKKFIPSLLTFVLLGCSGQHDTSEIKFDKNGNLNIDWIVENAEKAKIDFSILEGDLKVPANVMDAEFEVVEPLYYLDDEPPDPNCTIQKNSVKSRVFASPEKFYEKNKFGYLSYIETKDGNRYYTSGEYIFTPKMAYRTKGFSLEKYFSGRCQEKGKSPF